MINDEQKIATNLLHTYKELLYYISICPDIMENYMDEYLLLRIGSAIRFLKRFLNNNIPPNTYTFTCQKTGNSYENHSEWLYMADFNLNDIIKAFRPYFNELYGNEEELQEVLKIFNRY